MIPSKKNNAPLLKITLAALCFAGIAVGTASAGITINYVPVGDAGNAADTTGRGAVSYDYAIGKYEVTLTQYTTFLNAVAATDTHGLFNTNMGPTNGDAAGDLNIMGIARSGSPGSYTYAVAGDGNRPVTYVSMLDAMRFANWVNNGQLGAGTTETGAYTLTLGGTGLETHDPGATVWIPTENEWYKAAFYDPTKGGSDYWLYPTRSDSDPGNAVGPGANQANYNNGVFSVTQDGGYDSSQNYLAAGGAYSNSASHYGTFDQGGNVWEWDEAVIFGSNRGLRGGSWDSGSFDLQSSSPYDSNPFAELSNVGFRLASEPFTAIPEPTAIVTGLLCVGVAALRRRRPSAR